METITNTYTGKLTKLDLTNKLAYATIDFGNGPADTVQSVAAFLKMGFIEGEEFILEEIEKNENYGESSYYLRLKRK